SDPSQRDRVSIITFDRLTSGGPRIAQSLTWDYDAAIGACTRFQAAGDNGASTAIETGILKAREYLRPRREGGQGRRSADKVVVLLTDGHPNLYSSTREEVDRFINAQQHNIPHDRRSDVSKTNETEFDRIDRYARTAPLMQVVGMRDDRWRCYVVGIGMGADHDYTDRLSSSGSIDRKEISREEISLRELDHPTDDENRFVTLFEQILANPRVRLVQ
ncbi:MAG TPA: vWA domain-containing protein, partial [Thermoguttaceae bacterium]|nr:vWA domain-containing protein [Thermoguttaceae bacterium]